MRVKQLIKGSIDGVMDGTLTAGHLASDIQILLELIDKLQATPVAEQPAPAPSEQPAPQPEQPQPEQVTQEVPAAAEASPQG